MWKYTHGIRHIGTLTSIRVKCLFFDIGRLHSLSCVQANSETMQISGPHGTYRKKNPLRIRRGGPATSWQSIQLHPKHFLDLLFFNRGYENTLETLVAPRTAKIGIIRKDGVTELLK